MQHDFLPNGALFPLIACISTLGTMTSLAVVYPITSVMDAPSGLSMQIVTLDVHADSRTCLLMLLIGCLVLWKLVPVLLRSPWRMRHAE